MRNNDENQSGSVISHLLNLLRLWRIGFDEVPGLGKSCFLQILRSKPSTRYKSISRKSILSWLNNIGDYPSDHANATAATPTAIIIERTVKRGRDRRMGDGSGIQGVIDPIMRLCRPPDCGYRPNSVGSDTRKSRSIPDRPATGSRLRKMVPSHHRHRCAHRRPPRWQFVCRSRIFQDRSWGWWWR